MAVEPCASYFLTHSPAQVLEDVRPLIADVLPQQTADNAVSCFNSTVAAADSVAAEHNQVSPHVIFRMFAHVVKRQPDPREHPIEPDAAANRALSPFVMKRS